MNLFLDAVSVLSGTTSTTTTSSETSGSSVGTELKGIWNSMSDFMNSHSKAFAIGLSVLAALVVLCIVVVICKKLFFKKKKYYYRRRR